MSGPAGFTNSQGLEYVDPFRVGEKIPQGTTLTGRTQEEALALYESEGAKMLASEPHPNSTFGMSYAHQDQLIKNLRAAGATDLADSYVLQRSQAKERAREAEREFFRIANEVDKIPYFTLPNGRQIANVRGPLEDVRRAEQKTAIYDQAALARRGRRSTLEASRGGGGGSSSSSVTGLRSSSFSKTLLGG